MRSASSICDVGIEIIHNYYGIIIELLLAYYVPTENVLSIFKKLNSLLYKLIGERNWLFGRGCGLIRVKENKGGDRLHQIKYNLLCSRRGSHFYHDHLPTEVRYKGPIRL